MRKSVPQHDHVLDRQTSHKKEVSKGRVKQPASRVHGGIFVRCVGCVQNCELFGSPPPAHVTADVSTKRVLIHVTQPKETTKAVFELLQEHGS